MPAATTKRMHEKELEDILDKTLRSAERQEIDRRVVAPIVSTARAKMSLLRLRLANNIAETRFPAMERLEFFKKTLK
jgi:hypothetical protein